MICPCCEEELMYWDSYGLGIPGRFDFKELGDIFKCGNEDCECYQSTYYTKNDDGELYEGFPC